MKNYQFSDLLTYVTKNVLLFAYCSNTSNIKSYFDKNAAKNEILNKFVFRYSESLLTEKQKIETMSSVLIDSDQLPNLKNGSLQIVYNDYFKQSILLINNNFAIMCNVSQLPDINAKNAYNETLLSLFLHLATPQTITHDAKTIAKMLFQNTQYPIGKQYINSLKYLSNEVQNEFISLNDAFTPCKNEVTFFTFAPKVEKTATATAKTPKVETNIASPVNDTPVIASPVSPKLKAVEKMNLIYQSEKSRIESLPNKKSKIDIVKKFDTFTVETFCKYSHENSPLKTASFATWLNSEIAKNA